MQPINVEQYEEQRKRRIADRLQEDNLMYVQFQQERARLIAESEARLVEVRSQAEKDRLRYAEQVHLREEEIQRLRRVMQQVDQNALASQNAARAAEEELARARSQNVLAMRSASTSPQLDSHRAPLNAYPRRDVDLRPPWDSVGEGRDTTGRKI